MTDITEKLRASERITYEARNAIFEERKKSAEMLNLLVRINVALAGMDTGALADYGLTDVADRIDVFLKRKAQS